jgi:hypothetical protein
VIWADAGEVRKRVRPAMSSGIPKRPFKAIFIADSGKIEKFQDNKPVGCIDAKFLSPTVLKPKAVILLGNNLEAWMAWHK